MCTLSAGRFWGSMREADTQRAGSRGIGNHSLLSAFAVHVLSILPAVKRPLIILCAISLMVASCASEEEVRQVGLTNEAILAPILTAVSELKTAPCGAPGATKTPLPSDTEWLLTAIAIIRNDRPPLGCYVP